MRLLLAEDDQALADATVRRLREEGYAVDHAADGEEAELFLQTTAYDLIVLDWMLPGLDGLSLLRRVRARGVTTPALFLTARDQVTDRVTGLDAGADDYLVKPFAFAELLARVRALLRRGSFSSQGGTLRVGDVELDLGKRSVTRKGRPVELTARELQVLEYLMRNAGQVLTRSQIADHVWEFGQDVGSNVVDVYVYNLRRKLDVGSGAPPIRTVRGVGYQFGEERG
ncbi:response regulator transcription factor [Limnochorda pilosa]|uniref:PhoB family transcriptional regulator n=1 Tax=Limnochorda pilosa TaxID=1555112 RepID=A0A0K2SI95_LIMPI|nr:response regulator transcription factor [Limnochorda pilosa]BAS26737.1 PhoB family transcriptional regulator [Limnochorda pilosa]